MRRESRSRVLDTFIVVFVSRGVPFLQRSLGETERRRGVARIGEFSSGEKEEEILHARSSRGEGSEWTREQLEFRLRSKRALEASRPSRSDGPRRLSARPRVPVYLDHNLSYSPCFEWRHHFLLLVKLRARTSPRFTTTHADYLSSFVIHAARQFHNQVTKCIR